MVVHQAEMQYTFRLKGMLLVSATVNPYWTSYRLIANDRVYCGEVAAAIAHDITAMLNAEAISFVWGA